MSVNRNVESCHKSILPSSYAAYYSRCHSVFIFQHKQYLPYLITKAVLGDRSLATRNACLVILPIVVQFIIILRSSNSKIAKHYKCLLDKWRPSFQACTILFLQVLGLLRSVTLGICTKHSSLISKANRVELSNRIPHIKLLLMV